MLWFFYTCSVLYNWFAFHRSLTELIGVTAYRVLNYLQFLKKTCINYCLGFSKIQSIESDLFRSRVFENIPLVMLPKKKYKSYDFFAMTYKIFSQVYLLGTTYSSSCWFVGRG